MGGVMSGLVSSLGVGAMRILALLPLPALRALGWLLGWALYLLVADRRRIVQTNLSLCFSELPAHISRGLEAKIFIKFAQSWLDRSWLWHAPQAVLAQRLRITGAIEMLDGKAPTVLFAPHFMGLDAGWTALTLHIPRAFTTIYTDQTNKTLDAWILQGRQRFGHVRLFGRADGVREIASALKTGQALYLLPDMDFGEKDSLFVPFFGVSTATVPSLPRFARLGGAQVLSVATRLTVQGYEVHISGPWADFPTPDLHADTARMNRELETLIRSMPEQYYWVHKRFKTRPAGEAGVY